MIVAAFTVPAAASAGEWTEYDEEGPPVPLQQSMDLEFQGSTEVSEEGGFSYRCDDVSGQLSVEPGSQGGITDIEYSECVGQGGFSGLTFVVTPNDLPWAVEAGDASIGTDEVSVDIVAYYTYQFPYGNAVADWNNVQSTWNLVVDDPWAVSALELDGYNESAWKPEYGYFDVSPAGILGIS
ncbi:MAG TPA: hypothetical protein VK889_01365 [Solirubrobacterales bacterium]|nr:hypothetical protein [Solirubrobacterales bacterium]